VEAFREDHFVAQTQLLAGAALNRIPKVRPVCNIAAIFNALMTLRCSVHGARAQQRVPTVSPE